MMRFERAMKALAVHEGGYSDHPKDPGGRTMKGVTQRTYDAYRARKGLEKRHVRQIEDAEVYEIYRVQYWDAIRGDDLPPGVAYCVFDAAVNSGPGRAARWLQDVIGAKVDGVVGNETLAKAADLDPEFIIAAFCQKRLSFMKRLKHWPTFKNGWTRRVREVREQSIKWAKGYEPVESKVAQPAKADGPEKVTATVKDVLGDKGAMGGIAGVLGASGALLGGNGPVQYALAAVLVLGALTGIWWLVRGRRA